MYYSDWQYQRSMETTGLWKYGRQHSKECTCTDCLATLTFHRSRNNGFCHCEGCAATQRQLDIIEETEQRGRDAARFSEERQTPVANISICDRPECGSMIKSTVAGNLEMWTGGDEGGERVRAQLCPACVGEVMTWFEGAVGDRDRAYSKPWQRPAQSNLDDLTSTQLMQLAIERGREELSEK